MGKETSSKIFLTNYPRIKQYASFCKIGNESERLDIVCGYDIKVDSHEITLQIARDLITALLSFDCIYIEGYNVWDILQVFGSTYVKELLRLHILRIIPDQELNPVMIKHGDGIWKHDFFSYPQGCMLDGKIVKEIDVNNKWNHIENCFIKHQFRGLEADTVLCLIEENSVEIGNSDKIKEQINKETDRDIFNPVFLKDKDFYRVSSNGDIYYNQLQRIRLQELNKSVILAANLDVDNIKMDAAISGLMTRKTMSAFSKTIHCGTDALIKIEQQKGFPDLGELFVNRIIDLEDILKLRENFHGKIFRYWMKHSDYEEELMRQEIMNSVHNLLASKLANPLRMIACNLVGMAGFLPELAASAIDSYILDRVCKGWHPNFFLDDKLKSLIDRCIERKRQEEKTKRRDTLFKGVGRNDSCPCGSGKKFKYCHGK